MKSTKKFGPRLKRENVEMQTPWPKNAVAMPTYEKVQEYMGCVEKFQRLLALPLLVKKHPRLS